MINITRYKCYAALIKTDIFRDALNSTQIVAAGTIMEISNQCETIS